MTSIFRDLGLESDSGVGGHDLSQRVLAGGYAGSGVVLDADAVERCSSAA